MKTIIHKRRQSQKFHRKVILISERAEDKDCHTYVKKSFVYIVTPAVDDEKDVAPEIYIRKSFSTPDRVEKFSFKVRGYFLMNYQRRVFRVDFCHALKIDIVWKEHIFSPKKSATLT